MKFLKTDLATTDATPVPHHIENTGGGMRCGNCLKPFKSYLRLKKHMADQHGVQNEFTKMDMSRTNRESLRKERLYANEEKLKLEIEKIKHLKN